MRKIWSLVGKELQDNYGKTLRYTAFSQPSLDLTLNAPKGLTTITLK